MPVNLRTRVLVRHEDRLLLLPPSGGGGGGDCWTLPGGGWESGETLAECAAREVREETGLTVEVGEVAFLRERPWTFHTAGLDSERGLCLEVYFHAAPATDQGALRAEEARQAAPQWVPLREAVLLPLWPAELRPALLRLLEVAQTV